MNCERVRIYIIFGERQFVYRLEKQKNLTGNSITGKFLIFSMRLLLTGQNNTLFGCGYLGIPGLDD